MRIVISFMLVLLFSTPVFAAHPLITDDTGTQGKGKFQFELNGEYSKDGKEREAVFGAILSAGALDDLDIVLGVPYQFLESGDGADEEGVSDISVDAKWRFYEKNGLSLALKPGVVFDTGDEAKGLGDGKPSYRLFMVATKEIQNLKMHMNLGYIRNREELRDIWHYSLAAEYQATDKLIVVGNLGGETNPDRESAVHPIFLLGGLIYKVADYFDIDFGVKAGLNKAEADYTLLAGITMRI